MQPPTSGDELDKHSEPLWCQRKAARRNRRAQKSSKTSGYYERPTIQPTPRQPSRKRRNETLNLSEYTFDVLHRPGQLNVAADALSRLEEKRTLGDVLKMEDAGGHVLLHTMTVRNHERLKQFQAMDAE
ncbi:hypothetical protein MRX96_030833 [Rhipicephalus microplus]